VAPNRAATARTIAKQINGSARRTVLEANNAANSTAAEVHSSVPIAVSKKLMTLTE